MVLRNCACEQTLASWHLSDRPSIESNGMTKDFLNKKKGNIDKMGTCRHRPDRDTGRQTGRHRHPTPDIQTDREGKGDQRQAETRRDR